MPIINNLSGGEVEITKLADILTGTDYDITDAYFGDKHVFTVWGETEGALPLTFSANGDNAVELKVYGETGGVGQRTGNLFDKNATEDAYIDVEGNTHSSNTTKTSNYISVLENTSYTLYMSGDTSSTNLTAIVFFDSNKNLVSYTTYVPEQGSQSVSINTPASASYVRFSVNNLRENVMFTEGSTAPASYIPYGYEVPMAVESGSLFDPSVSPINYAMGEPDEQNRAQVVQVTKSGMFIFPIDNSSAKTFTVKIYSGIEIGVLRIAFADTIPLSNYQYVYDMVQVKTTSNPQVTSTNNGLRRYLLVQISSLYIEEYGTSGVMLNAGSTALPYQPYSHTSIPLYIGSTPLDQGEYTSYKDQKIYKYVSGVLTPTDPPVPIPALPTLDGVTVVDSELDSSAVQPEKAVIEYRKENT